MELNRLLEKHRLADAAISQGVSAIMNRVVSERRQRALPSDARQPQSNSNVTIVTAKETAMQPLHSAETKGLQLVPSLTSTGAQERGNDEDNRQTNEKGKEEEGSEEEKGEEEKNEDEEGGGENGGCDVILSGEGVDEVDGMTEGRFNGRK